MRWWRVCTTNKLSDNYGEVQALHFKTDYKQADTNTYAPYLQPKYFYKAEKILLFWANSFACKQTQALAGILGQRSMIRKAFWIPQVKYIRLLFVLIK